MRAVLHFCRDCCENGEGGTLPTGTALPQHSELSGSDDLFAFLRTTTLEPIAAPPYPPAGRLGASLDEDSAQADEAEQPSKVPRAAAETGLRGGRGGGRGGRGRGGRAEANASTADAENGSTGPAAKRRKRKGADDDDDDDKD